MIRNGVFGGVSELVACVDMCASMNESRRIETYNEFGRLTFRRGNGPCLRLRFTGPIDGGHYEYLEEVASEIPHFVPGARPRLPRNPRTCPTPVERPKKRRVPSQVNNGGICSGSSDNKIEKKDNDDWITVGPKGKLVKGGPLKDGRQGKNIPAGSTNDSGVMDIDLTVSDGADAVSSNNEGGKSPRRGKRRGKRSNRKKPSVNKSADDSGIITMDSSDSDESPAPKKPRRKQRPAKKGKKDNGSLSGQPRKKTKKGAPENEVDSGDIENNLSGSEGDLEMDDLITDDVAAIVDMQENGEALPPVLSDSDSVACGEDDGSSLDDPKEVDENVTSDCSDSEQRIERPNKWLPVQNFEIFARNANRTRDKGGYSRHYLCGAIYGDEDLESIEQMLLGTPSVTCEEVHCGALWWPLELNKDKRHRAPTKCCSRGKVALRETNGCFRDLDKSIADLYFGKGPRKEKFQHDIRLYNYAFAMVMVSGDIRNVGTTGRYALQINGQLSFLAHSKMPYDVKAPINAGQVYFLDSDIDTVSLRRACIKSGRRLEDDLLRKFEQYLRANNNFVHNFMFSSEVLQREERAAEEEGRAVRDVILAVNPRPKERQFRTLAKDFKRFVCDTTFNIPEGGEFVGAVFTGNVPSDINYDVLFYPRVRADDDPKGPRHLQYVMEGRSTLGSLSYPLIYLHGEDSFALDPSARGGVCSVQKYVRFRIMQRNTPSILHYSSRLYLQYLVDHALRIEYDRVRFQVGQQKKLWADSYENLLQFIKSKAEGVNKPFGRVVVLNSDIHGTQRNCQKNYLDAMAVVSKHGNPDLFITFTPNPNWPEIQETRPDVSWEFKPDVVCRVFKQKYDAMMSELVVDQIFGRVLAYIVVVEFQKRGLPHVHFVLSLVPQDKPTTPEQVDRLIWAELPDPKKYPTVSSLVKEHQIHAPCDNSSGVPRDKRRCYRKRRNGKTKCRFSYPKVFNHRTQIGGKYAVYRRRNRFSYLDEDIRIDSRWVVPFNPYLLMRYHCHICVEFCTCSLVLKYLFMYMNKGHDKTYVSLSEKNLRNDKAKHFDWDEAQHFREMRYLGACEAVYRINSYSFTECSHSVQTLPVHLPSQNIVTWVEGQEEEKAEKASTDTKLTAWFALNEEMNPSHLGRSPANNFYVDVVQDHAWNATHQKWISKDPCRGTIGRIQIVSLNQYSEETYFLRVLLINRPGMRSFEEVRTVAGELYDTYRQTCVALNLLHDEMECDRAMTEMCSLAVASQIRQMFVMLLLYCEPTCPGDLWKKFKKFMADDYAHLEDCESPLDRHYDMALWAISRLLSSHSRTLAMVHLPDPTLGEEELVVKPLEADTDDPMVVVQMVTLNEEQLKIFESVLMALQQGADWPVEKRLYFIHGTGGSGKTTLFNRMVAAAKEGGFKVISCAYTGITAVLLIDGMTSHRAFGFPSNEEMIADASFEKASSFTLQSPQAQKLKECHIIFWDEISMASCWQLDLADSFLRDLMDSKEPFGGKVVVLGGDFHQILPVVKNGSRHDVVAQSAIKANIWKSFQIFNLKTNMRAMMDETGYADWLLEVADGRANVHGSTRLELPADMLVKEVDSLLKFVFCDDNGTLMENIDQCVVLTPTNLCCAEVNNRVLDMIDGEETVYLSSTWVVDESPETAEIDHGSYTQEYLDELEPPSLPPHRLRLKVGCIVMVLRNLDLDSGLCNGTRLKVIWLGRNCVKGVIVNGVKKGQMVYLPRMVNQTRSLNLKGPLKRRQFPVKLAHSMTLNKSQGQTLEKVGIYLNVAPFAHGQVYVALSRARERAAIKILVEDGAQQGRGYLYGGRNIPTYTRNEIYEEILQALEE